jgi:succinate dehydrogenase/fumarate reductase-like Fe-S protein
MKTVTVNIQRGDADETRLEAFDVPYRDGMSVLDALIWIRNNTDPTLAFRYSCINANACKECVIKVDGKTDYACTARLAGQNVTVGPLTNKPLIRDLVTDTAPPKEKLAAALIKID